MTPKEKAEELYNIFDMIIYSNQDEHDQTKRCSIRCVEQMILSHGDASKKGKFTMNEEIGMIKCLITKYNFISKSEYARKEGISPQGVEARLKSNNDPYIKMIGKLFIIQ